MCTCTWFNKSASKSDNYPSIWDSTTLHSHKICISRSNQMSVKESVMLVTFMLLICVDVLQTAPTLSLFICFWLGLMSYKSYHMLSITWIDCVAAELHLSESFFCLFEKKYFMSRFSNPIKQTQGRIKMNFFTNSEANKYLNSWENQC